MKKFRKGFTLIELLIVIAIVGALSAMMAMSSAGAIDSAGANTILSNLQTMKTASFEMYMNNPEVASLLEIAFNGQTSVSVGTGNTNVRTVLGRYLGKKATALGEDYGLVGSSSHWYVAYKLGTKDSLGVREKLGAKASAADLYSTETINTKENDCGFGQDDYYQGDEINTAADIYIALKVR